MEPVVENNWRDELKEYFRSIEKISETALKSIKRDRFRQNLPFDDSFKDFILNRTSARIANVYTNLLHEEMLEYGQNVSNQDFNCEKIGNGQGHSNIGQQLSPTECVDFNGSRCDKPDKHPELIDLTSDQEEEKEEVVHGVGQNDRNQTNIRPQKVQEANAAENQKAEQSLNSTLNKSKNLENDRFFDTTDGNGEPTSTNDDAVNSHVNKHIQSVVLSGTATESNSHKMPIDSIDVPIDCEQRQDDDDAPAAAEGISNGQSPKMIDSISDQEDAMNCGGMEKGGPKNVENVAGPSQSMNQPRKWNNQNSVTGGNLKKKPKSSNAVDTKKQHECDYCEYSTAWKSDLTKHIRTHTGERPYDCVICDKRFTHKANLNRHVKAHRDMFAFKCMNCRQGFSDETQRKVHESRCKAKGYECYLCKRDFIRKENLVDHVRSHTGEKLQCPNCRRKFDSDHGHVYHMKTHGNLFRFQCSKCRQGFSSKKLWKLHESRCKCKQFECYLCGKKFYHEKGHLLEHMCRKHTGKKPFGCSDCAKRFCTKSELTRHSKRWH